MALKNCRECQRAISASANPCPLCGKKNPHGRSAIVVYGGGLLLGLLVTPYAVYTLTSEPASPVNAAASQVMPQTVAPPPASNPEGAPTNACGNQPSNDVIMYLGKVAVKRAYAPSSVTAASCKVASLSPPPECWRVECRLIERPWRAAEPVETTTTLSVVMHSATEVEPSQIFDDLGPFPTLDREHPVTCLAALLDYATRAGRSGQPDAVDQVLAAARDLWPAFSSAAKKTAAAKLKELEKDRRKLWMRTVEIRAEHAERMTKEGNFERAVELLDEADAIVNAFSGEDARAMRDLVTFERERVQRMRRIAAKGAGSTRRQLDLPIARLGHLLARCQGKPIEDVIDGRDRIMCTSKKPPAFAFEAIGDATDLDKVTLIVPMGGSASDLLGQITLGLEFFQSIAGAKVGAFTPKGWMKKIPSEDTQLIYQGRAYTTSVIPTMGITFSVIPAP